MAKKARIWTPNGKSVNADEVYRKIPFFCNTYNCDAPMVIVSMGEASAHFRSKSKQDHKFPICIRNDIEFNTDKYDKNLFDLSIFKKRILSSYEKKNIHKISRKGEIIGTGSKIAPDTLKSIYAVYLNDLHSGNNVIGNCKYTDFMKCKENFADFITNPCGFYIVETSYYHKVKDEQSLLLNVPIFDPKSLNHHVKVNFTNSNDFWKIYNHHKKLKNHI